MQKPAKERTHEICRTHLGHEEQMCTVEKGMFENKSKLSAMTCPQLV